MKAPFHFGYGSLKHRDSLHPDLQRVLDEAIKTYNFSIICGHRNETDQNKAYAEGKSQKKWPESKHNSWPSRAADLAPFPVDWNDRARFHVMMGHVESAAIRLGIAVRFGWDFNQNGKDDDRFKDLPHVELV